MARNRGAWPRAVKDDARAERRSAPARHAPPRPLEPHECLQAEAALTRAHNWQTVLSAAAEGIVADLALLELQVENALVQEGLGGSGLYRPLLDLASATARLAAHAQAAQATVEGWLAPTADPRQRSVRDCRDLALRVRQHALETTLLAAQSRELQVSARTLLETLQAPSSPSPTPASTPAAI